MKKIGLILVDMSTPIEKSAQVGINVLNVKRCSITQDYGGTTMRKGLIALGQIGLWNIMKYLERNKCSTEHIEVTQ